MLANGDIDYKFIEHKLGSVHPSTLSSLRLEQRTTGSSNLCVSVISGLMQTILRMLLISFSCNSKVCGVLSRPDHGLM